MGIKHNSRLAVVCRIKSTSIVKYIHSAQGRSQDFGEGGAYIEKRARSAKIWLTGNYASY